MTHAGRPKRALLAYCALAARLQGGAGIAQAMTPFFADVCRQFAGEMFDAQKFSNATNERFGFPVPRLAALALAEQLAEEGLLVEVSGHASRAVYKYSTSPPTTDEAVPALTEGQIERVLANFVEFCRADGKVNHVPDGDLENGFLDRLLHVDSMHLLTRREGSASAKRSANTLVLSKPAAADADATELHLDFLVSQFLLDLRDADAAAFDQVSNVAFANMAAEAIACFREPVSSAPLQSLIVYLDTPLVLDVLGVNAEYVEYGKELLDAIRAGGAKAAVFDHSVNEAENTLSAQLAYYRSGVNQWGTAGGTNAKPDLLSALSGNVAARITDVFGIEVHRDPDVGLHRRAQSVVGDIQVAMNEQMVAWRKEDAREHDQRTVWQMLALRNSSEPCPKVCDCQWLFLTRNTSLVNIANKAWNTWLRGATSHSTAQIDRWAPIAMSDKQFSGYLWARTGGGLGTSMPRARLLAHCSAAVRPRADVKARAYNLVIQYEGQEQAQYFTALLEDREAAKALMRATRGDPEDVTQERLPYIIDVMKRAAGEYAAQVVREEANAEKAELRLLYQQEVERATAAAEASALQRAKAQHDIELEGKEAEKRALAEAVRAHERAEDQRRQDAISAAFDSGRRVFTILRWGIVALFAGCAFAAVLVGVDAPLAGALIVAAVTGLGVWFVPDTMNRPLNGLARFVMRSELKAHYPLVAVPDGAIDFRDKNACKDLLQTQAAQPATAAVTT